MKLLLTSNGVANRSIADALVELTGKPAGQTKVGFIPTAAFVEEGDKDWLIDDLAKLKELGYYVDIIDIAQLTRGEWQKRLEPVDVICVGGGNQFYLSYWMQKSGFLDALPDLLKIKVYLGISAGSACVGDSLQASSEALKLSGMLKDDEYGEIGPDDRSSQVAAKLVPFVIRPHFNNSAFPKIKSEFLSKVAKTLSCRMYALDDQSALKIVDGRVEVISEGEWELFN